LFIAVEYGAAIYIEGRDVLVYTDHKPNITFDTVNMANRRHARWLDALQGYRLVWNYMKGALNIADSLSRNPVSNADVAHVTPNQVHFLGVIQSLPSPAEKLIDSVKFIDNVKLGYKSDPWFQDPCNVQSLVDRHMMNDDDVCWSLVQRLCSCPAQ
jgi:hypothetical protein